MSLVIGQVSLPRRTAAARALVGVMLAVLRGEQGREEVASGLSLDEYEPMELADAAGCLALGLVVDLSVALGERPYETASRLAYRIAEVEASL